MTFGSCRIFWAAAWGLYTKDSAFKLLLTLQRDIGNASRHRQRQQRSKIPVEAGIRSDIMLVTGRTLADGSSHCRVTDSQQRPLSWFLHTAGYQFHHMMWPHDVTTWCDHMTSPHDVSTVHEFMFLFCWKCFSLQAWKSVFCPHDKKNLIISFHMWKKVSFSLLNRKSITFRSDGVRWISCRRIKLSRLWKLFPHYTKCLCLPDTYW